MADCHNTEEHTSEIGEEGSEAGKEGSGRPATWGRCSAKRERMTNACTKTLARSVRLFDGRTETFVCRRPQQATPSQ